MLPGDRDQPGESKLIEKWLTCLNVVDLSEELCGGRE